MKTQYDYYRMSEKGNWYEQTYAALFHSLIIKGPHVPHTFNLTHSVFVRLKKYFGTRYIK